MANVSTLCHPPLTDADVYARSTQMSSHATNNQENQSGETDEIEGKERIKKGIVSERHGQSTIQSDPTEQARTQLSCSNEQKEYQSRSSHDAKWTYPDLRNATMA